MHFKWLRVSLRGWTRSWGQVTFPQSRLIGLFGIPPEGGEIREHGVDGGSAGVIFVDHRDAAIKQPVQLVAETGLPAPIGTRDTEFSHELGEGPA